MAQSYPGGMVFGASLWGKLFSSFMLHKVYLSINLSICNFIYVWLSVYLSIVLSVCLQLPNPTPVEWSSELLFGVNFLVHLCSTRCPKTLDLSIYNCISVSLFICLSYCLSVYKWLSPTPVEWSSELLLGVNFLVHLCSTRCPK